MKIGFIGLGNVGGKLAGSILRNGFELVVRDLDKSAAERFLDQGAGWADSPAEMARDCDIVITCLPSPAASAAVMEAEGAAARYRSFGWKEYIAGRMQDNFADYGVEDIQISHFKVGADA